MVNIAEKNYLDSKFINTSFQLLADYELAEYNQLTPYLSQSLLTALEMLLLKKVESLNFENYSLDDVTMFFSKSMDLKMKMIDLKLEKLVSIIENLTCAAVKEVVDRYLKM